MQVLEDTVAACKQIVEQQQPSHLEYKQKFSELVQISTELNDGVAAISAKRADEQKLYASALESINKCEHDRESLSLCLAQNQSKLAVLEKIVRQNSSCSSNFQETLQELASAKDKSACAWNEASKSMFLLDEQSLKIEELSDQMKELKTFYSSCMQPTAIAATVLNSPDCASSIKCTEAKSAETVS